MYKRAANTAETSQCQAERELAAKEAQMNQFRMDQQRTLQEVQLQNRIANERMQAEFSRQMGEMLRQQSTRDEPIPSVPPLESARLTHTVTRPSSVATSYNLDH